MFPKKLRSFVLLSLILCLLFLSLLLLANTLIRRPSVQRFFISKISNAIGFDIRTKQLEFNIWHGIGIFVHGFEARSRDGTQNIDASKIRIILDTSELLKGRIQPVSLYLYEPTIELSPADWGGRSGTVKSTKSLAGLPIWIPGLQFISVEKGQVRLNGVPFALENLFFDIRQKSSDPMTLELTSTGRVRHKGKKATFELQGTVSQPDGAAGLPFADVVFKTGKVPLSWVSLPESLRLKGGDFKAHLKVSGQLSGPISVRGDIVTDPIRLYPQDPKQRKAFPLPGITLNFRSVFEDGTIRAPHLRLTTSDISLSMAVRLDLKKKGDPYLEVEGKSGFVPFSSLKGLLPPWVLPTWLGEGLLPHLRGGELGLEQLSFKGRVAQIQELHLPENQSTVSFRLALKNLEVFGKTEGQAFQIVSANVIFKEGNLLLSNLRAKSKRSDLRKGSIGIRRLLSGNPSFDGFIEGTFDLQELFEQRDLDFIPRDFRERVDAIQSLSGRVELFVNFLYRSDWPLPKIRKADAIFRNASIKHRTLLFPLVLKEGEVHITENDQNQASGVGSWGNSAFEFKGAFEAGAQGFKFRRADIVADLDGKELFPLIYQGDKWNLKFGSPLNVHASLSKDDGSWSLQGQGGLADVVLETKGFSLAPPGREDRLLFALRFRPNKRIEIEKALLELGKSSLKLSGSYDLRNRDQYRLVLSSSSLSLGDLGIGSKKNAITTEGNLKLKVEMIGAGKNTSTESLKGYIEGVGVSFNSEQLPKPIRESSFKAVFTGEGATIAFWKMKMGESSFNLSGHIRGWDGLKGTFGVQSDFLDMADILPRASGPSPGDEGPNGDRFLDKVDLLLKLDISRWHWRDLKWGPTKGEVAVRGGNVYINGLRAKIDQTVLVTKGHVKTKGVKEWLFSTNIQAKDQSLETLLKGLGIEDLALQGRLTLDALLFMKGKEPADLLPSLTGVANVLIQEGTSREPPVIIKILEFFSLQKIFKQKPLDISKKGFYFERVGGHATIRDGVLETENFTMKSPVFNAVGSGKIDLPSGTIDFDLGAQPLQTVGTLVSKIPILGYILTGKKKSLLTYYFKVKGPLSAPEVTSVPFKSLGNSVAGPLMRLFLTPARLFKDLSQAAKDLPDVNQSWPDDAEYDE